MDFFSKNTISASVYLLFCVRTWIKLKGHAVRKQGKSCGETCGQGALAWLVTGEKPFSSCNETYTTFFPWPRDYNQNFLMGDTYTNLDNPAYLIWMQLRRPKW